MERAGGVAAGILALILGMPLSAEPASPAGTVLRGTIEVIGTIKLVSTIPASATVIATASAGLSGDGSGNTISRSVKVNHASKSATVTITLHYVWTPPGPDSLVSVGLAVDASSNTYHFASQTLYLPQPKAGATTIVRIPVSI